MGPSVALKNLTNERGFSLLEMLLVMFISFTIIGFITIFSFKFIDAHTDEQYMYQVQAKIKEAQFVSYANKQFQVISMRRNIFGIYAYRNYNWLHAQFTRKQVVANVYHANENITTSVMINHRMNLSGISKIVFYSRRGYDEFTMHLGKGRITHAYRSK